MERLFVQSGYGKLICLRPECNKVETHNSFPSLDLFLSVIMNFFTRPQDKIFVERHEKQAVKAGHYDAKRKRLDDHQGKLTAQQQYVDLT